MSETSLQSFRSGVLVEIPQEQIINAILEGDVSTPEELAEHLSISLLQAVKILNDKQFLDTLNDYSKAKANGYLHTKGIKRVLNIAEEGDNKESLQAIKLLSQFTGNVKEKGINVNVNLGDLIDREENHKEKNITPLLDLELEKELSI